MSAGPWQGSDAMTNAEDKPITEVWGSWPERPMEGQGKAP